ncbi:hypothetical protein IAR55_001158 [Kwoniella newhampshirensis]|uniref:Uncharacterized protein n=1 Tax=Kwoniella newhampshirensis TaxID=1651941 RepID=A0AAW0Z4Y1_9TREE
MSAPSTRDERFVARVEDEETSSEESHEFGQQSPNIAKHAKMMMSAVDTMHQSKYNPDDGRSWRPKDVKRHAKLTEQNAEEIKSIIRDMSNGIPRDVPETLLSQCNRALTLIRRKQRKAMKRQNLICQERRKVFEKVEEIVAHSFKPGKEFRSRAAGLEARKAQCLSRKEFIKKEADRAAAIENGQKGEDNIEQEEDTAQEDSMVKKMRGTRATTLRIGRDAKAMMFSPVMMIHVGSDFLLLEEMSYLRRR